MGGDLVGLVAVIMIFGIPVAGMYTYYRVRKLRTEERLAAIARGVSVPMEPDLSQAARSRRAGILLVTGALGYITAFVLVARIQADPDVGCAAAFGAIPLGCRHRLLPRFNPGSSRVARFLTSSCQTEGTSPTRPSKKRFRRMRWAE
jgi:hypothetical protein